LITTRIVDWLVPNPEVRSTLFSYEIGLLVIAGSVVLYLFLDGEERKRRAIQRSLEQSEEHYRVLVEGVRDFSLVLLAPDGEIVTWNAGATALNGYQSAEIVGQPMQLLYPEDGVNDLHAEELLQRARATGRAEYEGWRVRKDGTRYWANSVLTALHAPDGRFTGFAKITRDLTDRRAAEEALHLSEKRFEVIFYASPVGIIISDLTSGEVLDVNETFANLLGIQREALIGNNAVGMESWLNVEERAQVANALHGQGFVKDFEFTYLRQDRRKYVALLSAELIEFGNRRVVLSLVYDITERKAAEDALRRLTGELEQRIAERTADLEVAMNQALAADRLKSAFLATMSHELRTPLNSIIGFTGVLAQQLAGPLNEEQIKQLGMVRTSAYHLLALINDVLDISKIEAGQLEISPAPFELLAAVESALRTVQPLAQRKGLEISVEFDPSIGVIVSDRRRVEQILINLINNAVKFTVKGSVRVVCKRVDERLIVSVSDTGIGIMPEDQTKLFQPFQQVDTGLARSHEGTGLGLSICWNLTKLLGGTISLESARNVGSTFTIDLPYQPA
jgi:PAS domain S-box-containing protein